MARKMKLSQKKQENKTAVWIMNLYVRKKKAPVRYRKKDYQENSLTLKMI